MGGCKKTPVVNGLIASQSETDVNNNQTTTTLTTNNMAKRSRGFVLWEIMLALTIFCVVAVALTTAVQQTVEASILLRDESVHGHRQCGNDIGHGGLPQV